jgi:hypothetical protein
LELDIGFLPEVDFLIRVSSSRSHKRASKERRHAHHPLPVTRVGVGARHIEMDSVIWHLVCQKLECQGKQPPRNAENNSALTFWHLVCQKYSIIRVRNAVSLEEIRRAPTEANQGAAHHGRGRDRNRPDRAGDELQEQGV